MEPYRGLASETGTGYSDFVGETSDVPVDEAYDVRDVPDVSPETYDEDDERV